MHRPGSVRRGSKSPASRGFRHLTRAQAAGAHLDTLVATTDAGPDGLKVGLEPPRADVVRVAMLATHDRGLSTDFAMFGHSWTSKSLNREPLSIASQVTELPRCVSQVPTHRHLPTTGPSPEADKW